jgi:hypothetical protein
MAITACREKNSTSQEGGSLTFSEGTQEFQFKNVACGKNKADLTIKVTRPDSGGKSHRYVLALGSSPGIQYFEETGEGRHELISELVRHHDSIAIQIKYPDRQRACGPAGKVTGFFSACCGQGLEEIAHHHAKVYQLALGAAQFDRDLDPEKSLLGVGFNLGTLQLTSMAFSTGLPFDRIAMMGSIFGNVEQGCRNLTWANFLDPNLAKDLFSDSIDSMTQSAAGCTQKKGAKLELTSAYNFDELSHAQNWELGLFEGENSLDLKELMISQYPALAEANGVTRESKPMFLPFGVDLEYHPAQYIFDSRSLTNTEIHWYSGCGHDPYACVSGQSQVNRDLLKFLVSSK